MMKGRGWIASIVVGGIVFASGGHGLAQTIIIPGGPGCDLVDCSVDLPGQWTETIPVSCNSTIVKNGTTVTQDHKGEFRIRQNATDPKSTSVVWARNLTTANDLSLKTISDGQTAAWTNVVSGRYQVKARRSVTANCNGIFFGSGNYAWNYTVMYMLK